MSGTRQAEARRAARPDGVHLHGLGRPVGEILLKYGSAISNVHKDHSGIVRAEDLFWKSISISEPANAGVLFAQVCAKLLPHAQTLLFVVPRRPLCERRHCGSNEKHRNGQAGQSSE
jgi:hypothetical protein